VLYAIGPMLRAAIGADASLLAGEDWSPIFDLERFATERRGPRSPLRIGRHARNAPEKWPDTAEAILAAWPERDDLDVRILGGATTAEALLGRRPGNWTVHKFGARAPEDFLRDIDVFVFFHHPNWLETFGRAILEAMASGLPCILPRHFESTFGDAAITCEPADVVLHLDRLRDPEFYRVMSERALAMARRFAPDTHIARLARLGVPSPGAGAPSPSRPLSRGGWRHSRAVWQTRFFVHELTPAVVAFLAHMREWLRICFAEVRPQLIVAPGADVPAMLGGFTVGRLAAGRPLPAAGAPVTVQPLRSDPPLVAVNIPGEEALKGREKLIKAELLKAYCRWATHA
jgi:hypothetical protein